MSSDTKLESADQALAASPAPQKSGRNGAAAAKEKIWIDLDNSPHVPFFAPIIEELEKRGYSVALTARDCYQVRELADLFHLNYKLIGRHYGRNKVRKMAGLCFRALQLIPAILKEKPDLAVSNGSRSQLIVSAFLGIRCLFMGDYEFATNWAFIRPTCLLVPEVIPTAALRLDANRILKYRGIKEDVYVPRFVPERSIRPQLNLDENDIMVTIRPAASEAHYHNPESDKLFDAAVKFLSESRDVRLVALPRTEKQAMELKERWHDLFQSGSMRMPNGVVNGLNLIWHSDLVLSAGGTMNREAAALGVPVYSVFRGHIGSVDRYLAQQGRLELLQSVEEVQTKIRLERRNRPPRPPDSNGTVLSSIVEHIVAMMKPKCPSPSIGKNGAELGDPQFTK